MFTVVTAFACILTLHAHATQLHPCSIQYPGALVQCTFACAAVVECGARRIILQRPGLFGALWVCTIHVFACNVASGSSHRRLWISTALVKTCPISECVDRKRDRTILLRLAPVVCLPGQNVGRLVGAFRLQRRQGSTTNGVREFVFQIRRHGQRWTEELNELNQMNILCSPTPTQQFCNPFGER